MVLISIDTCRADHLSCYGYDRQTTPNIDAIAQDAVLFKRTMTPIPLTMPAHSSMFTGTYPPVHGARLNEGYHLADSNVTLAEIMKSRDFETAAFVGAFPLDSRFGLNQGFDTYDDQYPVTGDSQHDNQRTAGEVTRPAVAWLEENSKNPFFLFLHYFDPHRPYDPPPPFDVTYAEDPYAGEIAYVDSCIGQVVDKLRTLGLYDNTLIIVTGDHGEGLGDHGEVQHGFLIYQSTMQVPLIIRVPKGDHRGIQVDEAVSLVDIMPTVLGLIGLDVPRQVQGVNLSDHLDGRPAPERLTPIYGESLWPDLFGCSSLHGIVDGSWKYIRSPRPELYDLSQDGGETANVTDQEPEITRRLHARLEESLKAMESAATGHDSELVDREAVKRLESLGYLGGGGVRTEAVFDASLEDPKDFVATFEQYSLASGMFHERRFGEARQECLAIVSLRPRLVFPHWLLGEIALAEGHAATAGQHFSTAMSILTEAKDASTQLPLTVEAQSYWMAICHHGLGAVLMSEGKLEQAVEQFKLALLADSQLLQAYSRLGLALQQQGKIDEAIRCYQQALELQPGEANVHLNLGGLLQGQRKMVEAISHYEEAVQNKPDFAEAHHAWAGALLGLGRPVEAVKHYQEAVRIKPDFAEAHLAWGNLLQGVGRFEEAVKHYQETVRIKPDFAEGHYNWGNALQGLGRFEEAVQYYQEAVRLNPDDSEARYNWANALQPLGRFEEAVGHYQEALRIRPKFANAHNNLGKAFENLARFDKAAAEYQSALQLESGNISALNNLAWLLATCSDDALRDGPQAVKLAEQAARLTGHNNASILATLSAAYAEAGNFAQAVEWQEKAVRLVPDNQKERLRRHLESYESGKPYRQPDEAPSPG